MGMNGKTVLKNSALSAGILLLTVLVCLVFQRLDVVQHIPMIFVFAVFLISLLTDGYIWGIVSAFCGMRAAQLQKADGAACTCHPRQRH